MQSITLTQPDDWHCHLRDNAFLKMTAPASAQHFGRVIVMPNLLPPVTTCAQALAYRKRILAALPSQLATRFNPLMTLYLTDNTHIDTILETQQHPNIVAAKLYPAGATTHSSAGVTDIKKLYPVFEAMTEVGLPLLVHGEVIDHDVDIFDREQRFIESVLEPITNTFKKLRVVLEHITTLQAVQFVQNSSQNVAATITLHHLLLNRNDLLAGGIRPHYYCLPILKAQQHQHALQMAAISGDPRFFLGTDSAPHKQTDKESACGCAGIFTAPVAMALYTQFFESMQALDKLENFSSHFGPRFYQLPVNQNKLTLIKKPWTVPAHYCTAHDDKIIPFYAGKSLNWQVLDKG